MRPAQYERQARGHARSRQERMRPRAFDWHDEHPSRIYGPERARGRGRAHRSQTQTVTLRVMKRAHQTQGSLRRTSR